jgi:GDP-mannose transporter
MGVMTRTASFPTDKDLEAGSKKPLLAVKATAVTEDNEPYDHRPGKPVRSPSKVLALVLMFCSMSSTLLIINKAAMVKFPYPNAILFLQLATSSLMAHGIEVAGGERSSFTRRNLLLSLPVSISFFLGVSTSMNALRHINVDTMIVVKTCTPMLVAVAEWLFRDYDLPSSRTWVSLAAVVVSTSAAFSMHLTSLTAPGAAWILAWLISVVFNFVYSSVFVTAVKMSANGRVLCENAIAAAFAALPTLALEVPSMQLAGLWGSGGGLVLLSCLVGFGMSWFGWALREEVTALTYSVIGVVNKLFTVVANHIVWARHGPLSSSVLLALGITTAALYRQPAKLTEAAAAARTRRQRSITAAAGVLAVVFMVGTGLVLGRALSAMGQASLQQQQQQHLVRIQQPQQQQLQVSPQLKPMALGSTATRAVTITAA